MSSGHDGEIIAAVGAIRRTLARGGHSFHDLAELVESSINAQIESAGADDAWRHDIEALLRNIRKLNEWERRFVRTVSRYHHQPSAKQLRILAGIMTCSP